MSDPGEPTVFAGAGAGRRPGRDATLVAGDLLNGIYRVERFIARGGMGEVFEGVNIETEERVAIKAIRSHLASDPKVVALFRKEARVLTQFAHPAIVQYRVFARDPLIDLHYIVTDFIDGEPITAHLDGTARAIGDVVMLARRLATGLEVAHDHGAIHRDMSPDNVLLPHGRLDRAKIIDFGIAKSLDLVLETVVGDGFAGKLGYVAPEQFGDFDRQVGPWTDVYSTALVLLAFAAGKAPGMGTTLSEAVERRRLGPTNIALPPLLAPLIERMLVPDPATRIRSMREVLDGLADIRLPDTPVVSVQTESPEPPPKPIPDHRGEQLLALTMTTFAPPPADPPANSPPMDPRAAAPVPRSSKHVVKARPRLGDRHPRWMLIGAPLVVVALAGGFALSQAPRPPAEPTTPAPTHRVPARSAPPAGVPSAERLVRINTLLAAMPCTWVRAERTMESDVTRLSGVSASPATVGAQLAGKGKVFGPLDLHGVRPATVAQCDAIDMVRPFRATGSDLAAKTLLLSSSRAALGTGGPGCADGATVEVTVQDRDPSRDFALLALQSGGGVMQIAGSRGAFRQSALRDPARFAIGADGVYHASVCYVAAGPAAIFLVDGEPALELGLRNGTAVPVTAAFRQRFAAQGQQQHIRVSAKWTWIEAPAPTAVPPTGKTPLQPQLAEKVRPPRPGLSAVRRQSNSEVAEVNRRELDRLTPPHAAGSPAVCQTYGKRWKTIGNLSLADCISGGFERACDITAVQHGDRLLRRRNGVVQERLGHRWRTVAKLKAC